MKKTILARILFLFLLFSTFQVSACECECKGNCTFSGVSRGMDFVALVKIIEYSDFLDYKISGYDKKMPFSMTVEIIKKYKGIESRKRIKIWGDNGSLCRPYITNFKIGNFYLIAPKRIEKNTEIGKENDYDFFSCWTDYLSADFEKKEAYGEYSKRKKKISLDKFERNLNK